MAIGTMEIEQGCQENQWDIKKNLGHENETGNAFIPMNLVFHLLFYFNVNP
jgi:hypothetical protein